MPVISVRFLVKVRCGFSIWLIGQHIETKFSGRIVQQGHFSTHVYVKSPVLVVIRCLRAAVQTISTEKKIFVEHMYFKFPATKIF